MEYTYEELLPIYAAKAARWTDTRLAYEVGLLSNSGDSWGSKNVMRAWTDAVLAENLVRGLTPSA